MGYVGSRPYREWKKNEMTRDSIYTRGGRLMPEVWLIDWLTSISKIWIKAAYQICLAKI